MSWNDPDREIAMLADEVAFWAYQAKWYYAQAHGLDLDEHWKYIGTIFEQARIAENKERLPGIAFEPAHEIGS